MVPGAGSDPEELEMPEMGSRHHPGVHMRLEVLLVTGWRIHSWFVECMAGLVSRNEEAPAAENAFFTPLKEDCEDYGAAGSTGSCMTWEGATGL